MTSRIAPLLALALFFLGACATYSPDVPPGYTTASPRQTTRYLQWAFEMEYPLHVANCLSRELMEREGFTPADVEIFWPEVKEWAAEKLGDVESIEIEDIVDLENTERAMKRVTYRVGDRLVPVAFVRETTWELRHRSPVKEPVVGRPRSLSEVATLEDDRLVIRLDGIRDPETYSPDNLEKIVLTSAWLIHSVDQREMEQLGLDRSVP